MRVGAWLFRFSTDSEANMSISKRHILIYKDGKWQPESPGSDSEAEAVQEACQQWDKIASAAGYTGAENILDLDYSATQNKAKERKKVRDFEEEFGVPYFTQE